MSDTSSPAAEARHGVAEPSAPDHGDRGASAAGVSSTPSAARGAREDHAGPIRLAGKRVVLLLQGGGALGAYQVGAYQALAARCRAERGKGIDWVGGISIGAVNAAVIAGARPYDGRAPVEEDAARRLSDLWDELVACAAPPLDWTAPWHWFAPATRALSRWTAASTRRTPWLGWVLPPFRNARLLGKWWNWARLAYHPLGKFHFFSSRVLTPWNPWLQQWWWSLAPKQLAFYGTEPLRRTLERHVDFDRINGDGRTNGPRLSLGAARVRTGEVVFFENVPVRDERTGDPIVDPKTREPRYRTIGAHHVLASGALPPAFPPVRVEEPGIDAPGDDALYWDGGVSSNTPIEWLMRDLLPGDEGPDTVVFLIDVWDRKGPIPRSMDEACWRQKSIEYGSLRDAAKRAVREERLRRRAGGEERVGPRLEICQVMYERLDADEPQFAFADADFSRATYDEMVRRGREDMTGALDAAYEVLVEPPDDGVVLYRYGSCDKHLETDCIVARRGTAMAAPRRAVARTDG